MQIYGRYINRGVDNMQKQADNHELLVYELKWVLNVIYEVSDRIRGRLTDQTKYEERAINRVGRYLAIDKRNRYNKQYIIKLIEEVASSVIDRNKNEHYDLFTDLSEQDEETYEMIEYEPLDEMTASDYRYSEVEDEVIAKKTAALLAQDNRRMKIIKAWLIGNTNTSDISRTLARSLGGNVEGHRKFIQRFEKECRERLSTAI